MNKLILIALFSFLTLSVLSAQRKTQLFAIGGERPIAFGVNYEKIKDAYNMDVFHNNGIRSNYSTIRGRLTIDLLYANCGYCHSLLGRTQIDAQYMFKYHEINMIQVKSEKGGIMFKGRLRYYF